MLLDRMMIQTDRLELVPLTSAWLKLWIEDISALEKELNCTYKAEPMEGFFLDIVKGQLKVTEAVRAMCEFALKQPAVSCIIAETDLDGYASQRILERCGFRMDRQQETLWWKLDTKRLCNS